jgi:predicted porin
MAKTSDTQDRAGNLVYNGKFGDVGVMAEYDVTDATKTSQPNRQGNARALGVSYASGAINVAAAYTAQEANVASGIDNSMTHVTAGGGYNFGDGKVSVGYAKKSTKTAASDDTSTNMWLGGNFRVTSATNVLAAYYNRVTNTGAANATDVTTKVMLVGVTHDLSKKTQLYVSMDKTTISQNGSADNVATGSTLGISTAF